MELNGAKILYTIHTNIPVLGGIRLDIEGTELDGTVRSRLAGLRSSIAAATL